MAEVNAEQEQSQPSAGSARYEKGSTLGEGTYGVVFKARDKVDGRIVAIKKIRLGKYKEGVNVTALREIKLLKELKDQHVIELVDVYPHKRNLHLVFDFMESDLETLIKDRNVVLSPGDVKSYMQMTLKGLAYCHSKWVLHRDLKPNNLLISGKGELKLGDFGLARVFGSPDRNFTHQVFARWYRAPELLFGCKQYGAGVDMWAAGCVFAELMLRRPFLQGATDIDQLGKIFGALGTPTEAVWPDVKSLPDYVEYAPCVAPPLRSYFPNASEDAVDLLSRMLTYDPRKRITAKQALEHRYFFCHPVPTPPRSLPRPPPRVDTWLPPPPIHSPNAGPVVLSPNSKTRRLSFPPPQSQSEAAAARVQQQEGNNARDTAAMAVGGSGRAAPRPSITPGDATTAAAVGGREGDAAAPLPMSVDTQALGMSTGGGTMTGTTGTMTAGKGTTEALTSGDLPPRPTLSSADRKYLRKRKLDMDVAFTDASHE